MHGTHGPDCMSLWITRTGTNVKTLRIWSKSKQSPTDRTFDGIKSNGKYLNFDHSEVPWWERWRRTLRKETWNQGLHHLQLRRQVRPETNWTSPSFLILIFLVVLTKMGSILLLIVFHFVLFGLQSLCWRKKINFFDDVWISDSVTTSSWIFPFIGHMGICTSKGIIRDFAGPFFVGTNHMAFGKPTRYLILDQKKVVGELTYQLVIFFWKALVWSLLYTSF